MLYIDYDYLLPRCCQILTFILAPQKPDAFGDLLGGMGIPPPVMPQPNVPVENVVEDLQPGKRGIFYERHLFKIIMGNEVNLSKKRFEFSL